MFATSNIKIAAYFEFSKCLISWPSWDHETILNFSHNINYKSSMKAVFFFK